MLGTTICSTMWPSRSGGIPTPISEPSKVTRNRILLLLLPCNPYEVAPPLTMTSDNKGVNTFLGAQQQTLIKLSFMRFREGSFSETGLPINDVLGNSEGKKGAGAPLPRFLVSPLRLNT